MNEFTPQLSICIPTYNRDILLKEAIESILLSAGSLLHSIEIVISDNASGDQTELVVKEFQGRIPHLRYIRNAKTIEANHNIYAVAVAGTGKYIWVFGDDDKITPETIPAVLRLINENYNLILCNHSICSKDFSTVIQQKCLPFKEDRIIRSHNELMSTVGIKLGFISSVIIKKDVFFKIAEREYDQFIEYGFAFVYAIFRGIYESANVYIIAEPLVLQRGSNSSADTQIWYKYFSLGIALVFEKLKKDGYSWLSIYRAKNNVLRDYILHDISFRRRNNIKISGVLVQMFWHYKYNYNLWLFCVPAIILPSFILKTINRAAGGLRNITRHERRIIK